MILQCSSPSCAAQIELPQVDPYRLEVVLAEILSRDDFIIDPTPPPPLEYDGVHYDVRPAEGWTYNIVGNDGDWLCPRCTKEN